MGLSSIQNSQNDTNHLGKNMNRRNNDKISTIENHLQVPNQDGKHERSLSDASALQLIRKGTTLQAIRGFIADYSNATSIHGIKYLGARKKRWYERIIWLIAVVISFYYCSTLTIKTFKNWNNNPVIVSLAESSTPIWEIPFPAVTICPMVKYKWEQKLVEQLRKFQNSTTYDYFTKTEIDLFNAMANVCLTGSIYYKVEHQTKNNDSLLQYCNSEFLQILQKIAPKADETFQMIRWRDDDLKNDLKIVMKEVLTRDGICYSFNTLDDSLIFRNVKPYARNSPAFTTKWTLENGYAEKSGANAYPRRVLAGDNDESFHVMLNARLKDKDAECSGKSEGYKVILHTPNEYPQVSKRFFLVPFSQIVSVAVKPNMITTSPAVRNYSPEKRQCYFNDERYLKYFKIYTQGNCEHECLSNATMAACGCVKFSQQKTDDAMYCGAAKIKCYRKARQTILKKDGYNKICKCMPECTSVAYDAEVTQSVLNEVIGGGSTNETKNDDMDEIAQSTMKVFFGSNQFLSAKRSELYGIADLIANIGGLFGMFMGTSILSLVEIFYFCTVRMYVNMKLRKKNKMQKALENDGA